MPAADGDAHVDASHKPWCTAFVSVAALFPASAPLLPCHGTLKGLYMCMSNAMNMDVTSFFGAWPPARPLASRPAGT